VVWGTGTPRREFLHVDDLAAASIHLMETYDEPEIVNVGTGTDVTIRELAELLKEVVGYTGELVFDTAKPDGTPRKILDVSKLHSLGWRAGTEPRKGISDTYRWYLEQ